jgi:hypothetical protein
MIALSELEKMLAIENVNEVENHNSKVQSEPSYLNTDIMDVGNDKQVNEDIDTIANEPSDEENDIIECDDNS